MTKVCFVVMPFGSGWDEYYGSVYKPAIEGAGLRPERADDAFRAGSVLQDIVASLTNAAVVLVDISETNRNVHYELGLAHALGRPTLLVAPEGTPLFFDISQERMITFNKNNPFWGADLQNELTRALADTIAAPETAVPSVFMHIKPARLSVDEITIGLRRIEEQLAVLTRNSAPREQIRSGLVEKLHSPVEAKAQAARLLKTASPEQAVQQLVDEGYRRVMAESAVFEARGSSQREGRVGKGDSTA